MGDATDDFGRLKDSRGNTLDEYRMWRPAAMTPDEQAVERTAVNEMRLEVEGAVMDPRKREWLRLTVALAERALAQPKVGVGEARRLIERLRRPDCWVRVFEGVEAMDGAPIEAADLLEKLAQ